MKEFSTLSFLLQPSCATLTSLNCTESFRPTTPSATGEFTSTFPSSFVHQSSASYNIPILSQLHFTSAGCAVLDTPGMRELQLTDVEAGIADVFADIVALAGQCRFRDCQHDTEPGCAIHDAVARGEIDPARLARWHKLSAEERFNSSSLAERRNSEKSFQKMINTVQQKNKKQEK